MVVMIGIIGSAMVDRINAIADMQAAPYAYAPPSP
jgi:hypothetical protein